MDFLTQPIGYQRLISICEGRKEYENALDICNQAIEMNIQGEWNKKIDKIEKMKIKN